jgi:dihydroflavonol-4-reductase
MRVFLTGGTGFIGVPLVGALRQRGWLVTVLVRNQQSSVAQSLVQLGATLAPGDITDRESMRAPMTGVDLVIHNAAWYEVGIGGGAADRRMQAINVEGTRNTLTLAHELQVPRTVYVSSIAASGETGAALRDESFTRQVPPPNAYERTKTEAHQVALALIAQGAPILLAMPGSVFGPGDHANLGILQRLYVRGFAPALTVGGDFRRCQVYVDDCAEGIALIAERGRLGEPYLLVAGNMSYRELYALWSTTPGGMKQRAVLPRALAVASGMVAEPVQRWLRLPNLLSAEAARGAYSHYDYTGTKAMRELDWRPGDLRQRWLATLAEERRRAGKG